MEKRELYQGKGGLIMAYGNENYKQFIRDQAQFDVSGAWRKGVSISANDLRCGINGVQHISAKECLGGGAADETMRFGKYREKTLKWVSENDSRYFEWCLAEVGGFDQRAAKAGL